MDYRYRNDEEKEIIRKYNKLSSIRRFPVRLLTEISFKLMFLTLACSPRKNQRDEARRILRREGRTGLLEGSIIQNPLYVPNYDNSSLEFCDTLAGKWVGYDFNRISELGESALELHKGKLITFLLDRIADFPKDKYTPTRTFNFFNPGDILHFECPDVNYVIKNGLLEETSYKEAYENVGRYNKFSRNMAILGIEDEPIFQITPKGNGLVFLKSEGGSKVKRKKRFPELKPAFTH